MVWTGLGIMAFSEVAVLKGVMRTCEADAVGVLICGSL